MNTRLPVRTWHVLVKFESGGKAKRKILMGAVILNKAKDFYMAK